VLKGINYDVGTLFGASLSRVSWHLADVRRDLSVIRDELHCPTVNLFGTDVPRLTQAARIAREDGLGVWLQPRLIDQSKLARPQWWPALPLFSHRLNRLLARACEIGRGEFAGPLSHAAGLWERVDWRPFDLIGLNYYRMRQNRLGYARRLRRDRRRGKPVV
jgi:hypothetical protein